MSPPGRPKGEELRSAKHGVLSIHPPGRPKGEELRSAKHGVLSIPPPGRPKGEGLRSAKHHDEGIPMSSANDPSLDPTPAQRDASIDPPGPAAPPLRPLSYLAFDYGTRRVGVASGNGVTRTATPLRTVAAEGDARFQALGRLIDEWRPDALVVGVPLHPDGNAHDITARALRFSRQLQGRFRLPVHEVDERYTSTEAEAQGAVDVDAASAAIILEQYLRTLP